VPDSLLSWQPELRYLVLVEQGYEDVELAVQRNLVAALFRLERSRTPADIERVLANLIEWLSAPEQTGLRRAFVVWLKRVLLPARVAGADIPNIIELQEMHDMLAERVKTWTEEWKAEGRREGWREGQREGQREGRKQGEAKMLRRQLVRRFGELPDWVDGRLGEAGEAELETWADRVLEAGRLEDVFADQC
jgi:hypothetical protein